MPPPPAPCRAPSLGGARTPLGRSRSSLAGSLHGHAVGEDDFDPEFRTPSRRGTYSKFDLDSLATSAIPAPSGIPMPNSRRQSGGPALTGPGRRISSGIPNKP